MQNLLCVGSAALKTDSKCSFTARKVERDPGRFSPVFALHTSSSQDFEQVLRIDPWLKQQ
jgi:hypothetical protein